MNNKEAISELLHLYCYVDNRFKLALDVAIEALKKESQEQKITPPSCLTNPDRYAELLERYKE